MEGNFQLCCILHAQLLTVGVTLKDFQTALSNTDGYNAGPIVYTFKEGEEEYSRREHLRALKCSFDLAGTSISDEAKRQSICLVLAIACAIVQYAGPISSICQVMNRGWVEEPVEDETENYEH